MTNNQFLVVTPNFNRSASFIKQTLFAIAAFIAMVALTLIMLFLSDYFFPAAVAAESSPTTPAASVIPDDYPRLAKDMPARVEAAKNNQNAQTPAQMSFVFDDKLKTSQTTAALNAPSAAVNNAPKPNAPAAANTLPRAPRSNVVAVRPTYSSGNQMPPVPQLPANSVPTESSAVRLERRQYDFNRGAVVTPLPEIYDIEDVEPLGVVGTGDELEILLYSPTTEQIFSAPLGTKFRNGFLVDAIIIDDSVAGVNFKSFAENAPFISKPLIKYPGKDKTADQTGPGDSFAPRSLPNFPSPNGSGK